MLLLPKIAVKKDDLKLYADVQQVLWQAWSGKKKMRLEKLLYTREFFTGIGLIGGLKKDLMNWALPKLILTPRYGTRSLGDFGYIETLKQCIHAIEKEHSQADADTEAVCKYDLHTPLLAPMRQAMQKAVAEKMILFGSTGEA